MELRRRGVRVRRKRVERIMRENGCRHRGTPLLRPVPCHALGKPGVGQPLQNRVSSGN
ncbi:hypothetical protein [Rhodococcus wratislaviensis]|uniref:hypothetical protein n=1 Tax=Rhodococcus wratislaviensis TaxID=44752 RepID=UPI0012DE1AB1